MMNPTRLVLPLIFAATGAQAATLNITLDGVQPGGGALTVLLFDRAEGFPKEPKARARHTLPAGTTTLALDGLPPGEYAVMAYHDENGNGELDRFLGMIPKEGWGLSKNPKVSGKPAFKDAVIALPASGATTTIKLNY